MLQTLSKAIGKFVEDDLLTWAAALSFYTLFALPPLLYLLAMVISFGITGLANIDNGANGNSGDERASQFLQKQMGQLIGDRAAAAEVAQMLESVNEPGGYGWRSLLSVAGILIGATGLMAALQSSLNYVWKVKPDPNRSFAIHFLIKRLASLAMILGFGFLLLVSLVVSAVLSVVSDYATERLQLGGHLPSVLNQVLLFAITWVFFTTLYRFMPDAKVSYKHAVKGGLFTVVLFTLGRSVLSMYFQLAEPGQQLGAAAGSVAIILLWVYYSAVILLFGAEFTTSLSAQDHEPIEPELGAVKVVSGPN